MEKEKIEKSEVALKEEKILEFWEKSEIFKKTLEKEAPKGEFVFYDGPPFATGLPHQGTLLGSIAKDLIPRYKTMRGYSVRRRWGWDCHGLPIENLVEKKLGLKHKKDIEEMGIEKFNEECRSQVLTYVHDWKVYIDRVARWVDFEGSYKTMDSSYTESIWWALKQMNDKGLLYEGRKVLLYCPRCETPLSKAEIAMDNSYKDITEEAVTIKFKIKNPEKHKLPQNTYLLAWTTTPWTLPGNVALAVGNDIEYQVMKKGQETYVVSTQVWKQGILGEFGNLAIGDVRKGADLVGLEYEPLYEIPVVKNSGKKAWYVTSADFVNTEEGTGIVHTAVIYGEDDYQLGLKVDLPMVPLLLPNGEFNNEAPEFIRGMYVKKAERYIKEDLEKRDLLFSKTMNTHSYPHCYRCETPLIYNALSSWFINIQKIKKQVIDLNENINWVPDHLKHGRFLDIAQNAPDWTISRNRYWASPLPIWKDDKGKYIVIGSISELKDYIGRRNNYFLLRHGESEGNAKGVISCKKDGKDSLTSLGREESLSSVKELKNKKIDIIISSPFVRTRETAEIIAEEMGIPKEEIIYDDLLGEISCEKYDGELWTGFNFRKKEEGVETPRQVLSRTMKVMYGLDKKYESKNILIIGHGGPLRIIKLASSGLAEEDIMKHYYDDPPRNAKTIDCDFVALPHNGAYEIDLHRPYIDEVVLHDKDGSILKRIPEVIDCWVESGSMPFAEYNYPYSNKEEFEKRAPGDFVAEYIAQTRTWFYYMHVISTALFGRESFKNVLTTGNIQASDGSKMSKSKSNYTDPLLLMNKYGADALRYYMMTSVVMQAEDLNFKNDDVKEVNQRMLNILRNVLSFYEMYKTDFTGIPSKNNVLDKWICSRLAVLHKEVTEGLEKYDTIRSGRPIRLFIEDLSTWYLRRSRDRFKSENLEERKEVSECTAFILVELAKIMAPFTPYIAEEIYQGVKGKNHKESVHLENWTESMEDFLDRELIVQMQKVREVVTQALDLRQKAGYSVRQPLPSLVVSQNFSKELLDIIADEVNVKEIKVLEGSEVRLDTTLTEELKNEGIARSVIRGIQDVRKNEGLNPGERIKLIICADEKIKSVIVSFEILIKSPTQVVEIIYSNEKQTHAISLGSGEMTVTVSR
ncbi:MAG: class I tRNA ligase family protein [Candidatus Paceibacterota bacterium]|jgi:isoleucyl-tRNA synthetase